MVEKMKDGTVRLLHMRQFRLETEYGSVLGYLHRLNKHLQTVHTIQIDQTGVGDVFVEETIRSGLKNAKGSMLTLPMKQQILVYMKKQMEDGKILIPYDTGLINEINLQRFKLTKTGQIEFSHLEGTHDDRLWALALAVYASRPEIPSYKPAIAFGKAIKHLWSRPPNLYPLPGTSASTVTSTVRCLACWNPIGPDEKCPQGHQR